MLRIPADCLVEWMVGVGGPHTDLNGCSTSAPSCLAICVFLCSPSHGLFVQTPIQKCPVVFCVVHSLEPFVRWPVHRAESSLHCHWSARAQRAIFFSQQLCQVREFGHREAVFFRPWIRAISLMIHQGWKLFVHLSARTSLQVRRGKN